MYNKKYYYFHTQQIFTHFISIILFSNLFFSLQIQILTFIITKIPLKKSRLSSVNGEKNIFHNKISYYWFELKNNLLYGA